MLRRVASLFLKPMTEWYLKKERTFSFKDVKIIVPPGVFHPGLFSSTRFLLEFLSGRNTAGQSLLELGSGSGLISIVSAKAGAKVTAVDLSKKAVDATIRNAEKNAVSISVFQSDLFSQIPPQIFDWIIINPPFYPRKPNDEADLAWYCGEHHEYFLKLFENLSTYASAQTTTVMVLSEDCDMVAIAAIASTNGFKLEKVMEKRVFLFEKNFLFLVKGFAQTF